MFYSFNEFWALNGMRQTNIDGAREQAGRAWDFAEKLSQFKAEERIKFLESKLDKLEKELMVKSGWE